MKKYIYLGAVLIAAIVIIVSFINAKNTAELFGFELKIWTYRVIWFAYAIFMFLIYRKEMSRTTL